MSTGAPEPAPRAAHDRWVGEAPAKVNLFLRILAREEDGYHQIETVFQTLDLADAVELELQTGSEITLELTGVSEGELGPPEANLAVVAAERFQRALVEVARDPPGVRVRLEKRIPHGAGLGGGSSDAAAVLRGLNVLCGEPLTPEELMRLGAAIGSDVPFFVSGVPSAVGRGRGERLLALSPLPERDVLLAVPASPVSTAWAYEVLDSHRARTRPGGRPDPIPHRLDSGKGERGWDVVREEAVNDFEEALFPLRPELSLLKEALVREGAGPALLSGSGSAVFGVFDSKEALDRAASVLGSHDTTSFGVGVRFLTARTARGG
ncbi:MAG: 4-(cytidine 5'-diphospho)-2-C-methyl-D-erythritol kinase [Gemmatimonadetes bacterium]|nr:4-(cytidine 5'-diphospho)-2-C-methyl-D-erythritol kinase [Gemmatimonadota bacterium]